jgi:hypothetical protein
VLPFAALRCFEVQRLRPARGAGGSYLHVLVGTAIPAWPQKRITITAHPDPDGLDELARRLERHIGVPATALPDECDE